MSKLKHLTHVEDMLFDGFFFDGFDSLMAVVVRLYDGYVNPDWLKISVKYDGAPSVVFGINPDNGKMFVGTKSVFNKCRPKINYNKEDIQKNHGDKPELAEKLTKLLNYLKIDYNDGMWPDGVFQADLMGFNDDIVIDSLLHSLTPNTITYNFDPSSTLGKRISLSDCTLVCHTYYTGNVLAEMNASPMIDQNQFYDSAICWIDPYIDPDVSISDDRLIECKTLLSKCNSVYKLIRLSLIIDHRNMLKMFINHCVRMGEFQSDIEMYSTFLKNRNELDLQKELLANREQFNLIFGLHRDLSIIKHHIIKTLDLNSEFTHSVNNNPVSGEGYVVSFYGNVTKYVDRSEFSRLNFLNKKFEVANVKK